MANRVIRMRIDSTPSQFKVELKWRNGQKEYPTDLSKVDALLQEGGWYFLNNEVGRPFTPHDMSIGRLMTLVKSDKYPPVTAKSLQELLDA